MRTLCCAWKANEMLLYNMRPSSDRTLRSGLRSFDTRDDHHGQPLLYRPNFDAYQQRIPMDPDRSRIRTLLVTALLALTVASCSMD